MRDATINVMGAYTDGDATVNSGQLTQSEMDMYGSCRLGIYRSNVNVQNTAVPDTTHLSGMRIAYRYVYLRGEKLFELTNHLGNVLVTVSDKKMPVDDGTYNSSGIKLSDAPDGKFDYYNADVVSAQDYYPGGMVQPGRSYTAVNSAG